MENDPCITSDEDDNGLNDNDCFKVKKSPVVAVKYDIWLSGHVGHEVLDYVEICQILQDASEKDKVILHLANRGGSVDSGIMLANSIRQCKPGVDIYVEGMCYSMGAILALCGTSLTLRPGAWLMFHNYSGGEFGKGKEMLDAVVHYYDHIHEWLEDVTTPFLTPKEIDKLKQDSDVYVKYSDKDLKARIKRHFNGANSKNKA